MINFYAAKFPLFICNYLMQRTSSFIFMSKFTKYAFLQPETEKFLWECRRQAFDSSYLIIFDCVWLFQNFIHRSWEFHAILILLSIFTVQGSNSVLTSFNYRANWKTMNRFLLRHSMSLSVSNEAFEILKRILAFEKLSKRLWI
jgi:hypothetical protein